MSDYERLAKVIALLKNADGWVWPYIKRTCGSKDHDPRWCPHCESRCDGADSVAAYILREIGEE